MQVRYVLVYPEEKDLIIAGPAEPCASKWVLSPPTTTRLPSVTLSGPEE